MGQGCNSQMAEPGPPPVSRDSDRLDPVLDEQTQPTEDLRMILWKDVMPLSETQPLDTPHAALLAGREVDTATASLDLSTFPSPTSQVLSLH